MKHGINYKGDSFAIKIVTYQNLTKSNAQDTTAETTESKAEITEDAFRNIIAMRKEANALMNLKHQNILPLIDFVENDIWYKSNQ